MRLDDKGDLLIVGDKLHMRGTDLMSDGLGDKVKGTAEEVAGKVQEEGGKLTGNPSRKKRAGIRRWEGTTRRPREASRRKLKT